ncbi:dynein gamma chain, flagellar outer arm-like [Lingula anatina]|uniref:Dynein gamma chain, flagellar outer arm-like n=1 Tax=Lingula anatina TaxID=7574 RepID=A0A1S3I5A4_LINAN|nr:dynein gamma chain, flagellar outer arm-like [Lingula anatina]|eukprot:XP_013393403.1 dynein gamma chain, flagellar outer arm-like [Lingula anatina]
MAYDGDLSDDEDTGSQDDVPQSPSKYKPPSDHGGPPLNVIDEDEEEELAMMVDSREKQTPKHTRRHHDESHDSEGQQGLTKEDAKILRQYYPEDSETAEGPSVAAVVRDHSQKMAKLMAESVTTKTMLDVESKFDNDLVALYRASPTMDKDKFEETYTGFLLTVQDLEKFLGAYLNAVFMRKMKTQEGLQVITRFTPIMFRPGIRTVISEKFVEMFNWYEGDLEEVAKMYEKHKDAPQMLRNAPPVAGAIHWSRQLLKRIEDPMKVFRENKAITQLKDFGRVCKVYNRLATALVTFESLWFSDWKSRIEQARDGLRATLFVHHPETKQVVVNADERVLELIHEAKWLTRLGIEIPESAQSVLNQEDRFKSYKSHLELCLQEFHSVCNSIPESLKLLFKSHIEQVQLNFQPGLSTLAWNSMNIDAFLHQIHTATSKLKALVDGVNNIVDVKVQTTIDKVNGMFLFDYDLAFSKSWPPQEFIEVIVQSVKDKAREMYGHVSTIERGMHEIVTMLTNRKDGPQAPKPPSKVSSKLSNKGKKLTKVYNRFECMLSIEFESEITAFLSISDVDCV